MIDGTLDALEQSGAEPGLNALIARAERAQKEGDFSQALGLWHAVRSRHPDNDQGWATECALLLQFGSYDEAELTITQAARHLPESLMIASSACVTAMMRLDWVEAAVRLAHLCSDFPAHSYHETTVPGLRLTIDRGLAGIDGIVLEYLALAAEQAAETRRATAIRQHLFSRNPALLGHALVDNPACRYVLGGKMWEAGMQRLERGEWEDSQAFVPELSPTALDVARLAERFLGFGSGCELGSAQRQLGVEPLDLFRFANIDANDLADLIDQDLRPLGDPSEMALSVEPDGEYFVGLKDRRFYGHGFVYQHEMQPDTFFGRHVARLGLLARKLLADLESGRRIFLYHAPANRITDEKALTLHDAMRRRGNATLLVTRAAEAGHPDGSIAMLRPGLYAGRLGQGYGGERVAPTPTEWHSFLQKASDAIA